VQGLTFRQRQCLGFIATYWREHGYPPTLREICAHMSISSTLGAKDHLRALERKQVIELSKSQKSEARAFKITPAGWAELGFKGCPWCRHQVEAVA
jgi:repressor LexA